nr:MAG: hypothetical protein [Chiromantes dehaani nimavirus]
MDIDHGSTDTQATDPTSLFPPPQNDKEEVIDDLQLSIRLLEKYIPYCKQQLEGGVLKYEAVIKHDEEALSGLRKALDLVSNLQPSAYLKKTNFQNDGIIFVFEEEMVSYDVVWVMEKWECMLFRYATIFEKRSGYEWCTSFIKDGILDPCVTIQRWWKIILCRRHRASVSIQRWWRKILYQPDYFFKTSMFSKAKRNFDTSLKKDIAKAPAEDEENRDHHHRSPPPSLLKRSWWMSSCSPTKNTRLSKKRRWVSSCSPTKNTRSSKRRRCVRSCSFTKNTRSSKRRRPPSTSGALQRVCDTVDSPK